MSDKKNQTDETANSEAFSAAEPANPEETTLEEASGAAGTDQAQEMIDAEEEQGYRGTKADPLPNEHYTLEGVLKRAANKGKESK